MQFFCIKPKNRVSKGFFDTLPELDKAFLHPKAAKRKPIYPKKGAKTRWEPRNSQ